MHGCFWHSHEARRLNRPPKSRTEGWGRKLAANRARETSVRAELQAVGWECRTVWECEVLDAEALTQRLIAFLGPTRRENSRR